MGRFSIRIGAGTAVVAALALCAGPTTATGAPPNAIRVGGPSAPGERKVAIVGSSHALAGKRYVVLRDGTGSVGEGRLQAAPGKPAPAPNRGGGFSMAHAYSAPLPSGLTPGTYRVRVPALGRTSRGWIVRSAGSGNAIDRILEFFAANRDGNEPSPIHAPSHLHDATVTGGPHDGERLD